MHPEEYDKVPESDENHLGLEPKDTATPEGIRSVYHFEAVIEDKTDRIEYDAKALTNKIIEKFKASKCYKSKTENERKEIIKYIKENTKALPKTPSNVVRNC
jgi:hypothetical protein